MTHNDKTKLKLTNKINHRYLESLSLFPLISSASGGLISASGSVNFVAGREHNLLFGSLNSQRMVVVRGGEDVELGCHMLGRPLKFGRDGKWTTFVGRKSETRGYNSTTINTTNNNNLTTGSQIDDPQMSNYDDDDRHASSSSSVSAASDEFALTDQDQSDHHFHLDENDLVSLVFWYKDDNPTPIYTLDARQVAPTQVPYTTSYSQPPVTTNTNGKLAKQQAKWLNGSTNHPMHSSQQLQLPSVGGHERLIQNNRKLLEEAKHYPSNSRSNLNSRLRLDISSQFPIIKLLIRNTNGQDSGQYKCRVDFRRSRTMSQFVGLLVEGKSKFSRVYSCCCCWQSYFTSPSFFLGKTVCNNCEGKQEQFCNSMAPNGNVAD